MDTADLEFDNALWRFSLAVYAAPGVAEECLALQETSNIGVNLLLFCAWVGAGRRALLTQGDLSARTLPFAIGARMSCIPAPHAAETEIPLRRLRRVSLEGEVDRARNRADGTSYAVRPCARALASNLRNRCGEERAGEYPDLHPIRDARPDAAYDDVLPRKLKEAAIGLSR